jgi:hypothetical protein
MPPSKTLSHFPGKRSGGLSWGKRPCFATHDPRRGTRRRPFLPPLAGPGRLSGYGGSFGQLVASREVGRPSRLGGRAICQALAAGACCPGIQAAPRSASRRGALPARHRRPPQNGIALRIRCAREDDAPSSGHQQTRLKTLCSIVLWRRREHGKGRRAWPAHGLSNSVGPGVLPMGCPCPVLYRASIAVLPRLCRSPPSFPEVLAGHAWPALLAPRARPPERISGRGGDGAMGAGPRADQDRPPVSRGDEITDGWGCLQRLTCRVGNGV